MNIPVLIKNKRLQLQESQSAFGKRFGVSHAAVSDYERGVAEAGYKVINFCLDGVEVNRVICTACNGRGYVEERVTYNYEVDELHHIADARTKVVNTSEAVKI